MGTPRRTRRIAFVGFDRITALDLIGPSDVFTAANDLHAAAAPGGPALYELLLLGVDLQPFGGESGFRFLPQQTLAGASAIDTLIVPGGSGLREPPVLLAVATWLRRRQRGMRRICSVCTGVHALAEAGLLDGRRATTHWRFADAFARLYPRVKVDADAIYIREGKVYTSAGVTAGVDLALALVEEDHGRRLALAVARELVVYLKRAGGQRQFSARLSWTPVGGGRMAELGAWMANHLDQDLTVERLAAFCHLGPRQLARRFRLAFGTTPATYVRRLRMEEAAQMLTGGDSAIEQVAAAVGIADTDVFRRAFERYFDLAPSQFRARFRTSTETVG